MQSVYGVPPRTSPIPGGTPCTVYYTDEYKTQEIAKVPNMPCRALDDEEIDMQKTSEPTDEESYENPISQNKKALTKLYDDIFNDVTYFVSQSSKMSPKEYENRKSHLDTEQVVNGFCYMIGNTHCGVLTKIQKFETDIYTIRKTSTGFCPVDFKMAQYRTDPSKQWTYDTPYLIRSIVLQLQQDDNPMHNQFHQCLLVMNNKLKKYYILDPNGIEQSSYITQCFKSAYIDTHQNLIVGIPPNYKLLLAYDEEILAMETTAIQTKLELTNMHTAQLTSGICRPLVFFLAQFAIKQNTYTPWRPFNILVKNLSHEEILQAIDGFYYELWQNILKQNTMKTTQILKDPRFQQLLK